MDAGVMILHATLHVTAELIQTRCETYIMTPKFHISSCTEALITLVASLEELYDDKCCRAISGEK